jgi:hypothetical protein
MFGKNEKNKFNEIVWQNAWLEYANFCWLDSVGVKNQMKQHCFVKLT